MGEPLQVQHQLRRRLGGSAGRRARQQLLHRHAVEVRQLGEALHGHGTVAALVGADHDGLPAALGLLLDAVEGEALLGADGAELGPELFGVFAGHKAPQTAVSTCGSAAWLVTHCEVTQRNLASSSRMGQTFDRRGCRPGCSERPLVAWARVISTSFKVRPVRRRRRSVSYGRKQFRRSGSAPRAPGSRRPGHRAGADPHRPRDRRTRQGRRRRGAARHPHPRRLPRPPAGRQARGDHRAQDPGRLARHHHVPRRPAAAPGPRARPHGDPRPTASTAASSSSSTTCSSPAAPSAPPSTRWTTSAARAPCSSPSSSTAATANCPIRADYVGKNLPTSLRETVKVQLTEEDGRDAVLLGVRRPAPARRVRGSRADHPGRRALAHRVRTR